MLDPNQIKKIVEKFRKVEAPAEKKRKEVFYYDVSTLQGKKEKIYLSILDRLFFFKNIANRLSNLNFLREFDFLLYSARIPYSLEQYLAISLLLSFGLALFIFFISFLLLTLVGSGTAFISVFSILLAIFTFFATFIFSVKFPESILFKRAAEIEKDLPLALRGMASELKAGLGLFRVLRNLSALGYGTLSEEFSRTVREVEEGLSIEDALENMIDRNRSEKLKRAIKYITRALRTGSKLSDAIKQIADEIMFEERISIREFSEKINFISILYVFVAIVIPVFVAILAGLRTAPLRIGTSETLFSLIPFTLPLTTLFFVIVMPSILLIMLFLIKRISPR